MSSPIPEPSPLPVTIVSPATLSAKIISLFQHPTLLSGLLGLAFVWGLGILTYLIVLGVGQHNTLAQEDLKAWSAGIGVYAAALVRLVWQTPAPAGN